MNNDSIHECLVHEFNEEEVARMAPVFVILGIIVLLGCMGNAMSLFIYSRNFQDSNSRNFLILLSGVELFSSSVSVPMEIYNLYVHFNFTDDKLCKSFVYTEICQVSVSCSLLLLIATDRWRKVCQPFGWQVSVRLSKVLCVAIIPVGCLVASPSLVIYGTHYFDMNFSYADFPQCFETMDSSQTYNIIIVNTSRVLRTYKCSLTNEAVEGALPVLYSGFFWFLFFTEIVLLSLMYGKIIRTVSIQDNKLEKSAIMGEHDSRKVYPKPRYRRRESIDLDCETDTARSRYGISRTFVSDMSHDGENQKKPETTNNNVRRIFSSPSPKSESESIPDDREEAAIPRITVIKVEAIQDQPKEMTDRNKSLSRTLDTGFLSPIIKRQSKISTTSSKKRVTIGYNTDGLYNDQSDSKHTNNGVVNKNKTIILSIEDKNLVLSNQEETLAPIEENETLRVTNVTNLSENTECENGQMNETNTDSVGTLKNTEKERIPAYGKQSESCKTYNSDKTTLASDVSTDTKSVASKDNINSILEEKDIKLSPDPSPEHARVSHRSTRKLKRQSTRRQGRSRNVTVIMLAVTISTVICFLPYLVSSLLRSLITDFEANLSAPNRVAYNLFVRSIYFKSVLNPVIYGLFDSRYRQVLRKLLNRNCIKR